MASPIGHPSWRIIEGVYLDLDAEQARALLLAPLWRDAIDVWRDIDAIRALPAARRLLDAGADPEDLSRAMRAAALDAVFATLSRVDAGADAATDGVTSPPGSAASPGWCLVRTDPAGRPTATAVSSVRAGLLGLDPSGLAGGELRR